MVECLRHYEKVTLEFRTATRETALFLSYTRPHKPVTSQRLSHWMKDLMGEAGVDTKTFKALGARSINIISLDQRGLLSRHPKHSRLEQGVMSLHKDQFVCHEH